MTLTLTVSPGMVDVGQKTLARLFVTIRFIDGCLSITGVEGPNRHGGARGSYGQCCNVLLNVRKVAPGWTRSDIATLGAIWDRWHLNDLRIGSTVQMEWLHANPVEAVHPESYYGKASKDLANVGLNPDADGYKYGSAWKSETVPDEVIDWLFSRPASIVPSPW